MPANGTASSEQTVQKEFNLQQSIEDTVQDMLKDKEENPDLAIPYKFLHIYNRPEMIDLLNAIYDYATELFKLETKLEGMRSETSSRDILLPQFKTFESDRLNELARNMALKYGWLLMQQKGTRNKQEDQNLFETIIYFIARVLQSAFTKSQLPVLEEELNRLFRTTAFNLSHRRNIEEEKYRRFPQLKSVPRRDTDRVIRQIELRNSIPKDKLKFDPNISRVKRPGYVKLNAFKAINARSPLISMILPSDRDKIRAFEE